MKEQTYEQFDQYLEGVLSLEEKNIFENQLKNDPELALSFKIFKECNQQLNQKFGHEQALEAFKKNLQTIEKEHFSLQKPKVIRLKSWYLGVAASVTLLIGMFYLQNINPSFDTYNHPEVATFVERGRAENELQLAQETFNSKAYLQAIPHFEALLKARKSAEIQYFYAIALLEVNQLEKAAINLSDLRYGNSIYKNKATWYLALTKLKAKDYRSCKDILLTIPTDFEDYEQVKALLDDLE